MGKRSAAGPRKTKRNIPEAVVHLRATFNNTVVTITDKAGNTIAWCSAGMAGFKGSRKSTPFAAQLAAEQCGRKAMDNGVRSVEVHVNGPGSGRESAIRALQNLGIKISLIKDITPLPHNGCRPPKRRRV